MTTMTVEVEGLDKLIHKLDHVPDPYQELVEEAAQFGKDKMGGPDNQGYANPHPGADKGTLAAGVTYALAGKGLGMEARVGLLGTGFGMKSSLAALAPVVNYGRKPGKPPPRAAIRRWLKSHGYLSPDEKVAEHQVFKVQQEIHAHGTKGVMFLEKTEDAINKELPKMLAKAIKKGEALWGKN